MKQKLTSAEKRIVTFLENKDIARVDEIGNQCGYGESWARAKCQKLVNMGIVVRLNNSLYKLK